MGALKHIAIIMDGNGRWAKKRGLPKIEGHRRGSETASKITEACAALGVEELTLYTFSSENWKRPQAEVNGLMNLFEKALSRNLSRIVENNVVFNVIGKLDVLPESLLKIIDRCVEKTLNNSGIKLNLAVNYGGRQEILDAVKKICASDKRGDIDISGLNEDVFRKFLYSDNMPDPDLVIRTSGELRLSNFLIWQTAYSEFYVTDTLWPDFNGDELKKAVSEYAKRDRRFGE
ncbi:MAG: isoprenyl transferase [Candidatus Omnitrophota bacterium]